MATTLRDRALAEVPMCTLPMSVDNTAASCPAYAAEALARPLTLTLSGILGAAGLLPIGWPAGTLLAMTHLSG